MKTIKMFLASVMAIVALTFGASAQFYGGPNSGPAILTTTPLLISTATSNLNTGAAITAGYSRTFPIGPNGVGIATTVYTPDVSTKALVVTNIALTFQASVDGTLWIDYPTSVGNVVTYFTPSGTSVVTTYTNLQTVAAAAHNNLQNLRYLRPNWITNNNGTNWLYISNCVYSLR